MEPFTRLTSFGVPLLRANIDTDAIIPSREMRSASKTGLADGLFAGWRYRAIGSREPDPEFVLNDPAYRGAQILLAGENFGCGSSREHAVWALHEYGFRTIIAPSFSPIFFNNCVRNGILPVRLSAADVTGLATSAAQHKGAREITVDLSAQEVVDAQGVRRSFEIDRLSRQMLLSGLDEIDLTLAQSPQIERFLQTDRFLRPWIYLDELTHPRQ